MIGVQWGARACRSSSIKNRCDDRAFGDRFSVSYFAGDTSGEGMTRLSSLPRAPTAEMADSEGIHQLKQTIVALRQALEEAAGARDDISQTIRAKYEVEIAQLQGTIAVLRTELDEMRNGTQAAVVRAVATSANEIAELRQIITALREALETSRREHQHDIERINAKTKDKEIQMEGTIRAMREQLEQGAAQSTA